MSLASRRRLTIARGRAITILALCACATRSGGFVAAADPQRAFAAALVTLCDRAFEGMVIAPQPGDSAFTGQRIVMHVRQCRDDEIRIALHVGANRSRTWVITPVSGGLRLKHDHRHEDGREDAITQYGGDTRSAGNAATQEFYADAHTAQLIPAAATNVWTMEIVPGRRFAYALRREGTDRRFRLEFDLTRAVPAPPPPW